MASVRTSRNFEKRFSAMTSIKHRVSIDSAQTQTECAATLGTSAAPDRVLEDLARRYVQDLQVWRDLEIEAFRAMTTAADTPTRSTMSSLGDVARREQIVTTPAVREGMPIASVRAHLFELAGLISACDARDPWRLEIIALIMQAEQDFAESGGIDREHIATISVAIQRSEDALCCKTIR